MIKKTVVTDEGLKKLEEELKYLTSKKRQEIAGKIKEARSFGDLSENSEYDEAKNEQAIVEERINTLENMLKNVVILEDDDIATDHVNMGSKVKVKDLSDGSEEVFRIVGSTEVDILNGQISDESPIGSALLTHVVGDIVKAETPGGELSFEILDISK